MLVDKPLRYIDYLQAERYCCNLAQKIISYCGDDLASAVAVGVPRGGIIVLGMLSYALGLGKNQLVHGSPSYRGDNVLVVDDCCLSGRRFREFVEQLDADRIIFAHLVSGPGVREEILARDPRVKVCLAVEDIEAVDFASGLNPRKNDLDSDCEHGPAAFRYAAAEPVAFSWGEPQYPIWNASNKAYDEGWFHVTPRLCLESRVTLDFCADTSTTDSGYDVPADALWKKQGEELLVWKRRADKVYRFNHTAADTWFALLMFGRLDAAASYIAKRYGIEVEKAMEDASEAVRDFLERGLLETTPRVGIGV